MIKRFADAQAGEQGAKIGGRVDDRCAGGNPPPVGLKSGKRLHRCERRVSRMYPRSVQYPDVLFVRGFFKTCPSSATIRFQCTPNSGPEVVLAFLAFDGVLVFETAISFATVW